MRTGGLPLLDQWCSYTSVEIKKEIPEGNSAFAALLEISFSLVPSAVIREGLCSSKQARIAQMEEKCFICVLINFATNKRAILGDSLF